MLDARSIVHLPAAIKYPIVVILGSSLVVSLYIAISFVGNEGKSDWILLSLAVAQSTLTVFVVGLVLVFGQLGISAKQFERKSNVFLDETLPNSLKRVSINSMVEHNTEISVDQDIDIFGRNFHLRGNEFECKVWVGLNVYRLFCIYFVAVDETNSAYQSREKGARTFSEWLEKDVFQFTFGGAKKIGYSINYENAEVDGRKYVSIWMTVECDKDFLISPNEKLFWANDISMMTQSFIRTAHRFQIPTLTADAPRPL